MKNFGRAPSPETVVVFFVVAVGVVLNAGPISDNSMLWHIRTGVDIVTSGKVPTADPYSFTAAGAPWTVQSWFAEALYGALDRLGGLSAVVVLKVLLCGLLAWLVATLARAGSLPRTAVAAITAFALCVPYLTPRPLLFGLVCLAAAVLITERRLSPVLLLPVGWLWVNTHGSFPLILIWFCARIVGQAIDERGTAGLPWRHLGWMAGGLLAGAINPLGPKLLVFPFTTLGSKSEIFALINEWKSPDFHSAPALFLLPFFIVALSVLLARRPGWRHLMPVLALLALALYSQRNLPALGIVLAPALAAALRRSATDESAAGRTTSPFVSRAALAVVLIASIGAVGKVATSPALALDGYPVALLERLEERRGTGLRVATSDRVGGYRIYAQPEARVFIDDRYDMYPSEVAKDYVALVNGNGPSPAAVLERHGVEAVVWLEGRYLDHWLSARDDWRRTDGDGRYVVYERVAP